MKAKLPTSLANLSRRQFVTGVAAGSLLYGLGGLMPSFAKNATAKRKNQGPQMLRGTQFDLNIAYQKVNFTGRERMATAVNGSVPSPILRWREGDQVTLRVTNHLAHDSSIHWHGIILPTHMDGVPKLSYDGIKPGETFKYQFDVRQSGTFWYHSHSYFQEQTGMYGAIVIDPKEPTPAVYDRDYVVLLSDWSDEAPEDIYAKLKKLSHYYNFRERTIGDLWSDIKEKGVNQTWTEQSMWNQMRMNKTDLSDVTGYTYTFLMNGMTPEDGWLGLFKRGEKVRLRFINGAAMTIFDVRIPGLKMTVIAADGQSIEPVTVDEFRVGVAETYDVIVAPSDDSAYTIFAQSIDRTGYTLGTLTPDPSWIAKIPDMGPTPVLRHRDMGMGHRMHGMNHSQHAMSSMKTMNHSQHEGHQEPLGKAGFGSTRKITHSDTEFGPNVDMRADSPQDGLKDPGIGLRDHQKHYGRRILTYADIYNYYPTIDRREPGREIELHLTGNMSRYMWSMNGVKFADADPLQLKYGERIRITLVNDTMMTHPIHLHGMWSELETGNPNYIPRKHTVIVQPGSKISFLVTADAMGDGHSTAICCTTCQGCSGKFG